MRKIIYTFLISVLIGISIGLYLGYKIRPNIYLPTVVREKVNGKEIETIKYEKIDKDDILIKKNVSKEIVNDLSSVKKESNIKLFYPKIYFNGNIGLGCALIKIYSFDLDTFITFNKLNLDKLYLNVGLSYKIPYKRLSNTYVGINYGVKAINFGENNIKLYVALNF